MSNCHMVGVTCHGSFDLTPDYSDDESRSPRDSHMILGEQDDEISKYTGLIHREY